LLQRIGDKEVDLLQTLDVETPGSGEVSYPKRDEVDALIHRR